MKSMSYTDEGELVVGHLEETGHFVIDDMVLAANKYVQLKAIMLHVIENSEQEDHGNMRILDKFISDSTRILDIMEEIQQLGNQ